MSENKNAKTPADDGKPVAWQYAFPHDVGHLHEPNTAGMGLRDFFAAAVITGIFAGKWGQVPSQKPEVAFADIAYLVADEMLKRRER